mmetsp:Transcript_37011/g.102889  ORF Transcript_37011/g.102889 Transcript_37011/m.102889 type:complete len:221 (-) Transcript_37011:383-1045(-)
MCSAMAAGTVLALDPGPRDQGTAGLDVHCFFAERRGGPSQGQDRSGQPFRRLQHRRPCRAGLLQWLGHGRTQAHALVNAELEAHEPGLHLVRLVDPLRLRGRAAPDLERLLADTREDPERPRQPRDLRGGLSPGGGLRRAFRLRRVGPDAARVAQQRLDIGAARPRHALRLERHPRLHLLCKWNLARVSGLRALRLARADPGERPAGTLTAPAPGGHLRC